MDELSGGAALKYHIQRALERSHTISDFTKNLELSAKNSKFSNATMRKIEEITQGVKSAKENIIKQEEAIQNAITPLKEFGTNYPEFALKPKEALEKLLQEKNGQVAGAAFRDDLGGIDFVWGTPKTKDSVGYGLAHIIERREQKALSDGLSEAEAKEYALNIVKSIPEVLEKGSKGTDHLGRVFVDYGNKRVGLNNTWNNKELENHWVISSYELRDTTEKPTHFPTSQAITKEKDIHSLNSNENPTTNSATNQAPLSPLEQAQAEKLAKLESEKLESEQEFLKAKEQENKRKVALKKKLEH
ncbi:putative barnase/colicin E5 family endoribonuclease, partial [Helicobacter pylori]|uniref:putative barnase/colicin E5 family endoribonuclease n=1 Tax=Helicobacter pylori TaxID=210 RepID=UPI0015E6FABF